MTLTVGHLNVHNRLHAARVIIGRRPDSLGLAEAQHLLRPLAGAVRYRTVVESTRQGGGRRGTSQETPILTRKAYPTLGRLTLQVSEDARPIRVAPERWMTVHMFAHPIGPVAHFNIHPNAGARALHGDNPRVPHVREFAESMKSLDRALEWAAREGFIRVLTGDLQMRDVRHDPDWSPYLVLTEQGMAHHNVGPIDVIAWDRSLKLLRMDTLSPRQTRTDHPGGIAYLGR